MYNSYSANALPSATDTKPADYPYGVSIWRATVQVGWPVDGQATTFRSADGICWQLVSGYSAAASNNIQVRIGFAGSVPGTLNNTWGAFMSVGSAAPGASGLSGSALFSFNLTTDPPTQDLTVAVTGASPGDAVSLSVPNASMPPNVGFNAWVSSFGVVTVRAFCLHGSVVIPPGTFKVLVTKF